MGSPIQGAKHNKTKAHLKPITFTPGLELNEPDPKNMRANSADPHTENLEVSEFSKPSKRVNTSLPHLERGTGRFRLGPR